MSHDTVPGPLAGVAVCDLSTVLAGPFCTMLLADLGADVVKVEPPEGDATRGWGPPWVGSKAEGTRTAAYFLAVNRNKRSLRLDLRHDEGRRILTRLIERSDVLVENFRPGAFDAMGFGDDELRRLNDRLLHLAISGYGRTGPDARKPGYDFVLQAVGGLMSITGLPDDEGGRPTKVGVAIADIVTGLFGAVGALSALVARDHRERPAGGQRIDVSILESTLAVLVNQAQNAFVGGRAPRRLGNAHPNIVPYETFPTSDGEIVIAAGTERHWQRVCEALEMPALADDARFAKNEDRVEHRDQLRPLLVAALASRTSEDWLRRLEAAQVPCGRINDVLEALSTPQARALGVRVPLEHPLIGAVDQVASAIGLTRTPTAIRTPPPILGEHNREVLEELGFEPSDVLRFHETGVV